MLFSLNEYRKQLIKPLMCVNKVSMTKGFSLKNDIGLSAQTTDDKNSMI